MKHITRLTFSRLLACLYFIKASSLFVLGSDKNIKYYEQHMRREEELTQLD
jgi:hypothetical protein